MELLRAPQPVDEMQEHQRIVDMIVGNDRWPAIDKAKILGANALIFNSQPKIEALYQHAEARQWIYHHIHDSKQSVEERVAAMARYDSADLRAAIIVDSALNYREKLDWYSRMAKKKADIKADLPRLIGVVITFDTTLNVQQKIVILESWAKRYPASKDLQGAINSQREYLRQHTPSASASTRSAPVPSTPAPTAAPASGNGRTLSQIKPAKTAIGSTRTPTSAAPASGDPFMAYSISVESMMKNPWVQTYAKLEGIDNARLGAILKTYWYDLTAMASLHWAHRGEQFEHNGLKMWGPAKAVKFQDLVAQMALSYLEMETRFNPSGALPWNQRLDLAHFYQAFNGKESNWLTGAQGYTSGLSNGTGPFQLTGICVYATSVEKIDDINVKVAGWGGKTFSKSMGHYWNPKAKKWVSLVQVQATVSEPAKKGKKAKTKKVLYEPESRSIPPKAGEIVVRGPKFKSELTDPAKAIRAASAALIMYGAHPGMSISEMEQVAERYNGNNRLYKTPEGDTMKIKQRYKKEIGARVDLSSDYNQARKK